MTYQEAMRVLQGLKAEADERMQALFPGKVWDAWRRRACAARLCIQRLTRPTAEVKTPAQVCLDAALWYRGVAGECTGSKRKDYLAQARYAEDFAAVLEGQVES